MIKYINKKDVTISHLNQTFATICAIKYYNVIKNNYKYLLMIKNTIMKLDNWKNKMNYHSKNKKYTNKAYLAMQVIKKKKKISINHFNKFNNLMNYT